jgi:uncharacterized protein YfkK (UPF0435 family)
MVIFIILRSEGDNLKVVRSSSLFSFLSNTLKGDKIVKSESTADLEFWKMDLIESNDKVKYKIDAINSKLKEENIFLLGARRLAESENIQTKILESEQKIQCLNKSLLKYQGLAVIDQDKQVGGFRKDEKMRFSGRITLKLHSCLDLIGKRMASSEIFLVVKVDGIRKAQSSYSRGKWDEEVTLDVDKAMELEFLVLERDGGVLAMIWFSFRMLIDNITTFYNSSGILPRAVDNSSTIISSPSGILSNGKDNLESVFELEPAGKLHVEIRLGIFSLSI